MEKVSLQQRLNQFQHEVSPLLASQPRLGSLSSLLQQNSNTSCPPPLPPASVFLIRDGCGPPWNGLQPPPPLHWVLDVMGEARGAAWPPHQG